jgi:hypothetical protein
MKRLISLLLLTACALPVWAAKKTSVQELKDTLISLNQNKKTDEEIATRLKDTEMSEELTRATLKDFAQYLPGPLSIEQMEVLEGRSALLPPPPSDLPNTPAPDVAAQKASSPKPSTTSPKPTCSIPISLSTNRPPAFRMASKASAPTPV